MHRIPGILLLLLVALGMATSLAAAQPMEHDQAPKPEWTKATLQLDDLGPDFILVHEDFREAPGAASYLVGYQRQGLRPEGEPFEAGSAIIIADVDLGAEFDVIVTTMLQQRAGLGVVAGPSLGDDSRWYGGMWSAANADDEAYVLISRQGNAVIAVGLVGAPGSVQQQAVLDLASLIWERYPGK